MYDDYIHSYGPRPPGRIPAMLMKTPFSLSTDCKRVALVPMLTDVVRLQSGLH